MIRHFDYCSNVSEKLANMVVTCWIVFLFAQWMRHEDTSGKVLHGVVAEVMCPNNVGHGKLWRQFTRISHPETLPNCQTLWNLHTVISGKVWIQILFPPLPASPLPPSPHLPLQMGFNGPEISWFVITDHTSLQFAHGPGF